jgi:hypothetical protein
MAILDSILNGQMFNFGSSIKKQRMASKEDLDLEMQKMLAKSTEEWVMINLASNPNLHVSIQEKFVFQFRQLDAIEFVNDNLPLKHRMKIQKFLKVIGELSANPNLDLEFQHVISNTIVRLDEETNLYLRENQFETYIAEDVLHWVKADLQAIAYAILNNTSITDQNIRNMLTDRFGKITSQPCIWGDAKADDVAIPQSQIWSTAESERTINKN